MATNLESSLIFVQEDLFFLLRLIFIRKKRDRKFLKFSFDNISLTVSFRLFFSTDLEILLISLQVDLFLLISINLD